MGILVQNKIAKNDTRTTKLFESLLPGTDFLHIKYSSAQDYVKQYWEALKNAKQPSLEGNVFEYIIYTLLYREGIKPFYTQAQVTFVPNINFDTILYSNKTPVSLSLKTSLRERYKQADLEAIALKYVHRKSECYLLTMSTSEANNVKQKILDGEIIGLDEIIDCNTEDINKLIEHLKSIQFIESQLAPIVTGNLVK